MFLVCNPVGGGEYLGVLDTWGTISIVAKTFLPRADLKNIMRTAAIGMGHGHVMHSCGQSIVHRFYVMDSEAFDFVLGTDFADHPQIRLLTLQAPHVCHVDHDDGLKSVPL